MPLYESVFITRQDVPSGEVESLAETFAGIVGDNGGAVEKREYWGLRNLAYRIKKNRKGHYTMFHIDAPAVAVQEMERNMRISEDILRYLTIRVDAFEEGPSIIMQTRSARDDRQRRDGPRRDRHGPARDGQAAKTDAPKTDAPKADAPKTDAPKTDAPKADAPKADAPKVDKPETEAPKAAAADEGGEMASKTTAETAEE